MPQSSKHTTLPVLTFAPQYKHVVWGGDRIARYKGKKPVGEDVGESWEISPIEGRESVCLTAGYEGRTLPDIALEYPRELLGRRGVELFGSKFPLLVKIIDARTDLSVQVHPDDDMARRLHGCSGKSEAWYCLPGEPGSQLYVGFNRRMTLEEYRRRVANGTIAAALRSITPRPGDVHCLPAGTIHAIGGGNLLLEVQQASDITYRIYDWGRPRPLHVEESAEAIFKGREAVSGSRQTDSEPLPLDTPHFCVSQLPGQRDMTLATPGQRSFSILFAVSGQFRLTDEGQRVTDLSQGSTALVPASSAQLRVQGDGTMVRVTLP